MYTYYNHSLIDSFPIDYNKFPLATNYKYVEIILNPGDYLLIPNHWSHWVFSEPYTIAISYSINNERLYEDEKNKVNNCTLGTFGVNKDNIIFDSIAKNLAHTGTYKSNFNINYKDFIYSTLNYNFKFICSDTTDVCPAIKPNMNNNKISFNAKLEDVINDKTMINKYLYIGQHHITTPDITTPDITTPDDVNNYFYNLFDIPNFDNIINDVSFSYTPRLWFNFDKPIDSGLHYDKADTILYVLTGKKKVLLSHPQFLQYIYLDKLHGINHI
jgi:hypothetical protein